MSVLLLVKCARHLIQRALVFNRPAYTLPKTKQSASVHCTTCTEKKLLLCPARFQGMHRCLLRRLNFAVSTCQQLLSSLLGIGSRAIFVIVLILVYVSKDHGALKCVSCISLVVGFQ